MRRRAFLGLFGALAAVPALAQQPGRTYRVGVLIDGSVESGRALLRTLLPRLAEQGFVEGRNLSVQWRSSFVLPEGAGTLVKELMSARPDAYLAVGSKYVRLLQESVSPAPVVFVQVGDALAFGLVKEYARPGGNVTGVSQRQGETMGKRLELLRELLPKARRVAVVGNTYIPAFNHSRELLWTLARSKLGFEPVLADLCCFEVEGAIHFVHKPGLDGMIVEIPTASGSGESLVRKAIAYAARHRIPAVYLDAAAADAGGLLAYGADTADDIHRGADQLARVLKGADPSRTPVDQATRYELVVNQKTARALGITIPQSVLLRADRVIE